MFGNSGKAGAPVKYSDAAPLPIDDSSNKVLTTCFVDGCTKYKDIETATLDSPFESQPSALVSGNNHVYKEHMEKDQKEGTLNKKPKIVYAVQFCKRCKTLHVHYHRQTEDTHFNETQERQRIYTGCGTQWYSVAGQCGKCSTTQ